MATNDPAGSNDKSVGAFTLTEEEAARIEELEAQYDPEMNFRTVAPWLRTAITWSLVLLGLYHFYTCLLYTSPSPRDRG